MQGMEKIMAGWGNMQGIKYRLGLRKIIIVIARFEIVQKPLSFVVENP